MEQSELQLAFWRTRRRGKPKTKEDLRHAILVCGAGTHCLGYIQRQLLVQRKWHNTLNAVAHKRVGKHAILHALLVSLSRLIRYLMPPHFRMVALLAGILANSPKAPTTLTSTFSGWSDRRPTRVVKVSYSWNLSGAKRNRSTSTLH